MTMIRPRSDIVYGVCRGIPSELRLHTKHQVDVVVSSRERYDEHIIYKFVSDGRTKLIQYIFEVSGIY